MKNKGQSTLEYIVVFTVIVAAVIIGAAAMAGNQQTSGIGNLFGKASQTIRQSSNQVGQIVPKIPKAPEVE
jgi:uncharacterized protein (UPF0333 family)